MRATTLLAHLLGEKHLRVRDLTLSAEGLVADLSLTTHLPRCAGCGRPVRKVHDRRTRRWRHLDLAGVRLTLRYLLRRAVCPRCGALVERVPCAAHGARFTHAFEDAVAFLASDADFATVATLARTTVRSVTAIVC